MSNKLLARFQIDGRARARDYIPFPLSMSVSAFSFHAPSTTLSLIYWFLDTNLSLLQPLSNSLSCAAGS